MYSSADRRPDVLFFSFFFDSVCFWSRQPPQRAQAAVRVVGQAIESVVHSIRIFEAPIEEERIIDALTDMVYKTLFVKA